MPKFSIIIPVYNSEKTIAACVNAVLNQDDQGSFEIIAVDDGSTDTTPDILKTFERVLYIRQENAGPASARNAGFAHSAGDVVCFTDADCIPEPGWLLRAAQYFEDRTVDVLAGSYGIVNRESLLARCIHAEILFRHQNLMGQWVDVFGSYNVFFRREVFERVGGFDESYRNASGEDNDLSYRLRAAGNRIRFAQDVRVGHTHPSRSARYLREQFRHGFWRVHLYRKHPKRLTGDGYTFFKDLAEVPLSLVLMALPLIILGGHVAVALGILAGAVAAESYFAQLFGLRGFKPVVFYGLVMTARALARTLGLGAGFLSPKSQVPSLKSQVPSPKSREGHKSAPEPRNP